MSRMTIDYGIDLGTTNSSIAVRNGVKAELIRNNENAESTPSAVYLDKKGKLIVGRVALEKVASEPNNSASEFKLQMGSDHSYRFDRDGREMTPEQLSAEVLKALREDVLQRTGEDLRAAVISVPAAFELPQCEATRRAAEMAGLALSPLVQEPVAAAMAYGFQDETDKAFWLVYDIGGGTFDAAIVQLRDGMIQVTNHGGDNHLGGKLVDWGIVDQLLVPAIQAQYSPEDFRRGNPNWAPTFAKLKRESEKAKIQLSRDKSAEIQVEFLPIGASGAPKDFEFTLERTHIETLLEPVVARTIDICRKVMREKGLGAADFAKLIFVGGPTLTPYLRERIAARLDGLGIPLEFSVDPLTIVAQGAAIFAGTQRFEGVALPRVRSRGYQLELEYKPVGPDLDPIVGGRVIPAEPQDLSGFSIEFLNKGADPSWRSGKIPLDDSGAFTAELRAERGVENSFEVKLLSADGTVLEVEPGRFPYTVGQVITDPPLTHSVGVALANNDVQWFFQKGIPLPARAGPIPLRTAVHVKKGQDEARVRIPVIEGEFARADRNTLIGQLEIPPDKVTRDLPIGSEVEITIEIDRSRILHVEAYVPVVDLTVRQPISLEYAQPDATELTKSLENERERLAHLRVRSRGSEAAGAEESIDEVDRQDLVQEIETSLASAEGDRDALDRAEHRLRDLKTKLDRAEDSLEWPSLVSEAEGELETTRSVVQQFAESDDRMEAEVLERELLEAMETHDPEILRAKVGQMMQFRFKLLVKQPSFWVGYLGFLEERLSQMSDRRLANDLFARGKRAIQQGDLPTLQSIIRQLNALLPIEAQVEPYKAFRSTVTR